MEGASETSLGTSVLEARTDCGMSLRPAPCNLHGLEGKLEQIHCCGQKSLLHTKIQLVFKRNLALTYRKFPPSLQGPLMEERQCVCFISVSRSSTSRQNSTNYSPAE